MRRPRVSRYTDEAMLDEVVTFVYGETGYYAYTRGGLQLNIVSTVAVQPHIKESTNFHSFLWVESLEGFFLLAQHFVHERPGPWLIYRKLTPRERFRFFQDFQPKLQKYIASYPPPILEEATS